jgi:hypothetical protein
MTQKPKQILKNPPVGRFSGYGKPVSVSRWALVISQAKNKTNKLIVAPLKSTAVSLSIVHVKLAVAISALPPRSMPIIPFHVPFPRSIPYREPELIHSAMIQMQHYILVMTCIYCFWFVSKFVDKGLECPLQNKITNCATFPTTFN